MEKPIEGSPLRQVNEWIKFATEKTDLEYPNAAALATVNNQKVPSVRMVLVKQVDDSGLVFFTNLSSRKSRDISEVANVSLCFFWDQIKRQVNINGQAEQISDEEADRYFATRPRRSRIGAWASKQSQRLTSRHELEKRVAFFVTKFGLGEISRPKFWSGFKVTPSRIEFWQEKPFRLHDRRCFELDEDGCWHSFALFP
ncbi:MAG: pyridoxamine 5'-phosphate oxidase [Bdellovibrionota bacterium]